MGYNNGGYTLHLDMSKEALPYLIELFNISEQPEISKAVQSNMKDSSKIFVKDDYLSITDAVYDKLRQLKVKP